MCVTGCGLIEASALICADAVDLFHLIRNSVRHLMGNSVRNLMGNSVRHLIRNSVELLGAFGHVFLYGFAMRARLCFLSSFSLQART